MSQPTTTVTSSQRKALVDALWCMQRFEPQLTQEQRLFSAYNDVFALHPRCPVPAEYQALLHMLDHAVQRRVRWEWAKTGLIFFLFGWVVGLMLWIYLWYHLIPH